MLYTLIGLAALAAGVLIGVAYGKKGQRRIQETLAETKLEAARKQTLLEAQQAQHNKELEMREQHYASLANAEREKAAEQLEAVRAGFETERKAWKETNEQTKRSEEDMRVRTELLKKEFQILANQILEDKSTSLKATNKEQLDAVLAPLKENIDKLGKSVQENRMASIRHKESFEYAIKGLMEKTEKIGNDAVNLAKALKANPKVQGDWGEMILERMLEESGLRKGEEYFIQENCVTEDGRNVRPDVIVRFPEKRSVIIDSKVSLTAYVHYTEADEPADREAALASHLASVRNHVDELAAKDYSKAVDGAIGYVLMFVPNEGSYIVAVERDKELLNYAYKRHIIVIGPSNLMMALQLAYNLWQSERQSRNVEEIIKRGNLLYEKFVTFVNTFEKIGDRLEDVRKQYDAALGTLARGNGNLIAGMGKMKQLGLNPKKEISSAMQGKVEGAAD